MINYKKSGFNKFKIEPMTVVLLCWFVWGIDANIYPGPYHTTFDWWPAISSICPKDLPERSRGLFFETIFKLKKE